MQKKYRAFYKNNALLEIKQCNECRNIVIERCTIYVYRDAEGKPHFFGQIYRYVRKNHVYAKYVMRNFYLCKLYRMV